VAREDAVNAVTRASARGFTLVELLLAMALAALLATASVASLNLFVAADQKAITHAELGVDVTRVLHRLRRDIESAASIDLQARQWTFRYADGTNSIWAVPPGDTELHRFTGNDLLALLVPVQALLLSVAPAPVFDARGRLRESSYSATAMLQGDIVVAAQAITSPYNGNVIGASIEIRYGAGDSRKSQSCIACAMPLVEANCKP
jgi:prepilin-type N-terminal cleavage/methylation domain-containing protein